MVGEVVGGAYRAQRMEARDVDDGLPVAVVSSQVSVVGASGVLVVYGGRVLVPCLLIDDEPLGAVADAHRDEGVARHEDVSDVGRCWSADHDGVSRGLPLSAGVDDQTVGDECELLCLGDEVGANGVVFRGDDEVFPLKKAAPWKCDVERTDTEERTVCRWRGAADLSYPPLGQTERARDLGVAATETIARLLDGCAPDAGQLDRSLLVGGKEFGSSPATADRVKVAA